MSPLRTRFHDFMTYRCLSERTIEAYMAAITKLTRFYNRSPEDISFDEIIQYVNHLSKTEGKTFSTCNQAISAFKCFYNQFLGDNTLSFKLPPRRCPQKLPVVLSPRRDKAPDRCSRNSPGTDYSDDSVCLRNEERRVETLRTQAHR